MSEAIRFTIPVFCIATMFAMGLDVTLDDIVAPFRNKLAIAIIILANNVIVPLLAVILLAAVAMLPPPFREPAQQLAGLGDPQKIGFLLMTLAAGGISVPSLVELARGNVALAKGTIIALLLATVIVMPLEIRLLTNYDVAGLGNIGIAGSIFKTLLLFLLLPFAIGVAIKVWYSALAGLIRPLLNQLASLTFLVLLAMLAFEGLPQEASTVQTHLFDVGAEFVTDLNKGQMPDRLPLEFNTKQVNLSPEAWVNVQKLGEEWEIVDAGKRYAIKRNTDADAQLKVYELTTYLFTLEPELVSDLDNGQVPDQLPATFNLYGLTLSSKTQIDPIQTGKKWAVIDGDKKYFIEYKDDKIIVYAVDRYLLNLQQNGVGDDLDKEQMPGALRTAFQQRNVSLSSEAQVTAIQPGNKWSISDGANRYTTEREDKKLLVYAELTEPQGPIAVFVNVLQKQPGVVTLTNYVEQLGILIPPIVVFSIMAILILVIGYYTGLLVSNAIDATHADSTQALVTTRVRNTLAIATGVRNVTATLMAAYMITWPNATTHADQPDLSVIKTVFIFYTVSLIVAAIQADRWSRQPETAPVAPASQSPIAVIASEHGVTSTP